MWNFYSLNGDRRILYLSLSRSHGIPGLPQEKLVALRSVLFFGMLSPRLSPMCILDGKAVCHVSGPSGTSGFCYNFYAVPSSFPSTCPHIRPSGRREGRILQKRAHQLLPQDLPAINTGASEPVELRSSHRPSQRQRAKESDKEHGTGRSRTVLS